MFFQTCWVSKSDHFRVTRKRAGFRSEVRSVVGIGVTAVFSVTLSSLVLSHSAEFRKCDSIAIGINKIGHCSTCSDNTLEYGRMCY